MSSFMEQLKKTSDENTEELREKRRQEALAKKRKDILAQLFKYIQKKCMEAAKNGNRGIYCSIHEALYQFLDDDNDWIFFRNPGDGYGFSSDEETRRRRSVFCNPVEIKNYIEDALVKAGFEKFELTEKEIPLYEVVEKVRENSAGEKFLSGTMNLLLGTNYDVDTTTRKVRKQIGTQVIDFKLHIEWE